MQQSIIWECPLDYDQYATEIQQHNANILTSILIQHLPKKNYLSAIDVGCGTGAVLQRIHNSQLFNKITGIDISASMLGSAKEKLQHTQNNIELRCEDFMQAIFDTQFSVVVSNAAFHWFSDDYDAAFSRLTGLAQNGGIIAIATAGLCTEVEQFDSHIDAALSIPSSQSFSTRRLTMQHLRKLAHSSNLNIVDVFTLLRSSRMPSDGYASWLVASGLGGQAGQLLEVHTIKNLLHSYFGEYIDLYHCSIYGLFKKREMLDACT